MPSRTVNPVARIQSRIAFGVCVLFTLVIIGILVLVTGYLISLGAHSLSWKFFTQDPIAFGNDAGGMRNGLVGTLILVGLASVIGIPVGILAGIFLSEYSANSRLANPIRFTADVLTGVPSIVVGILGYELVVVPLGHYSGWAGAAALAFIMIPIVARTSEEMLRLVPNSYREASIALGATKARTIISVVVPAATGSLVTGVMLAIARVAGETAPLIFTAAGASYLVLNPNKPFPSLTAEIYDARSASNPAQEQSAWAGILVLIFLIFVVNIGMRYLARPKRIHK